MSQPISRRKWITGGLTVGAAGVAATQIASRCGLIPPDSGGIWGPGETLTYAAQRVLTSGNSLAREFRPGQISTVAPVSGEPPEDFEYQRLLAQHFAEWELAIEGMVAKPSVFTLAQLQQMPATSQITHQACEEGWSFIAEWGGVQVSHILQAVGADAKAKYVVFYPFDSAWESLDMADALHPQTLLAYAMNGERLPTRHGAPLRLRVARQLGYKSIKYLSHIEVTDSLKEIGKGLGSSSPEGGYSWWAGI
ncbi:MAG: molybdopterin-dependent oxidoreductase [Bryobacteraceae bacterium]